MVKYYYGLYGDYISLRISSILGRAEYRFRQAFIINTQSADLVAAGIDLQICGCNAFDA